MRVSREDINKRFIIRIDTLNEYLQDISFTYKFYLYREQEVVMDFNGIPIALEQSDPCISQPIVLINQHHIYNLPINGILEAYVDSLHLYTLVMCIDTVKNTPYAWYSMNIFKDGQLNVDMLKVTLYKGA